MKPPKTIPLLLSAATLLICVAFLYPSAEDAQRSRGSDPAVQALKKSPLQPSQEAIGVNEGTPSKPAMVPRIRVVDLPQEHSPPQAKQKLPQRFSRLPQANATGKDRSDFLQAAEPKVEQASPRERSLSEGDFPDSEDGSQGSNRIFGSRASSGTTETLPDNETPSDSEESAEPEPSPSPAPLFFGQPRGLALLGMMHPLARDSSQTLLELLDEARLAHSVIGVLIDGTFRFDSAFLIDWIRRLSIGERRVTLVLYLASGPTMRRSDSTPIQTAFSRLSPTEFEEEVTSDSDVQSAFLAVLSKARSLFDANIAIDPNNQNVLIPVLEDDMSADGFLRLKDFITRQSLDPTVEIIRNSTLFPNPRRQEFGAIEFHSTDFLGNGRIGDALSLDGQGFHFRSSEATATSISANELGSLLQDEQALQLSYVMLWQAQWQGLANSSQLQHPDDRSYVAPSENFHSLFIDLLRSGLTSENS